jgi:hypothetical protein
MKPDHITRLNDAVTQIGHVHSYGVARCKEGNRLMTHRIRVRDFLLMGMRLMTHSTIMFAVVGQWPSDHGEGEYRPDSAANDLLRSDVFAEM